MDYQTSDHRPRRTPKPLWKILLYGFFGVAALYLTCTGPFWLFALGWYDSSRVGRYQEFLGEMPSELTRAMPPAVPAGAQDVRMKYHAGMLQAKPWMELRYVLPTADATSLAESVSSRAIDDGGWHLSRWAMQLETMKGRDSAKNAAPTVKWFMLALQNDHRLGFTAVAIDPTTGEVVYFIVTD